MINQENLNKMYEGIIEGKELTTKELNGYGFNSKDLADLINEGILQESRGHYLFTDFDGLYSYGKKLIRKKQYDKAKICFEACYELDKTHQDVCFQLFFRNICEYRYDKAFQYFDVFYFSDNEYYDSVNNFYLYLLSMVTVLPEKHQQFAKFISFGDVKVEYNRDYQEDIYVQNRIRTYALNQNFDSALTYLKNNLLRNKHSYNGFQNWVIKILLERAAANKKRNEKILIQLINEEDYKNAIIHLEQIEKSHNLNYLDSYILILLKKIVNIRENHVVPEKKTIDTNKLFDAIDADNYDLALSLYTINGNQIDVNKSPIYLLLCKINDEIKKSMQISSYLKKEDALKPCEANIPEYIRVFYDCLEQQKYEEARLFLELIHMSKSLIESDFLIEVLEYTLDSLQSKLKTSVLPIKNATETSTYEKKLTLN